MAKNTTLVSPDGVEYEAGSQVEATRLIARGYRVKKASKPKPSN